MRRIICLLLFVSILLMSGCSATVFDSDAWLRPPNSGGEAQLIQEALTSYLGKQPLFRYPRKGDYRSAFVRADIDGDGEQEAVVFYRLGADSPGTSVCVLDVNSTGWYAAAAVDGPGGDVERVLFGDIDTTGGERRQEMVVGWSVSSAGGIFTAYSFTGTGLEAMAIDEDAALQNERSIASYTEMVLADLDSDGSDEIITVSLDSAEGTSDAAMITFSGGKLTRAGSIKLDGTLLRYGETKSGQLDNSQEAVFIDGYRSSEILTTEVVIWDSATGSLSAPLNDPEGFVVSESDREVMMYSCDIDNDQTVEFPCSEPLPGYSDAAANQMSLINWYSFDTLEGRIADTPKLSTIIDINEDFYVALPTQWLGRITARAEQKSGVTYFCSVADNGGFGKELFRIKVFSGDERDMLESSGYTLLASDEDTLYALYISDQESPLEITESKLKLCFSLLE